MPFIMIMILTVRVITTMVKITRMITITIIIIRVISIMLRSWRLALPRLRRDLQRLSRR